MKFIVFTDLHLHTYDNAEKKEAHLNVLDEVFKYAHSKDIDLIVFGGDLFHTFGTLKSVIINETMARFYKLFSIYSGIKFLSISGNHDHTYKNLIDKPSPSAQQYLDIAFSNFILIDNETYVHNGFNFTGVPYYTHFSPEVIPPKGDYLIMHQTPTDIPFTTPDLDLNNFKGYKYIFCGHIHQHKLYKNSMLVGSPIQCDMAEAGEDKGFIVFDTKGTFERVILDLYEYPIVTKPKALKTALNEVKLESEETLIERFLLDQSKLDYLTRGKELINEAKSNLH